MTLEEANALLHRMAFETPWHPGFCAACPCREKMTHGRFGLMSNIDHGPCPLLPIEDGTLDVDAALRERIARVEWSGAGCCLACHAMLPVTPEGVVFDPRRCHRPGCEVAAILATPGRRA